MKQIVHLMKLREMIGKKLYDFLVLQQKLFDEQNKNIDNSDITLTREEFDILSSVPKEEWTEEFIAKLPKIEEDILKLSERGDYAVFTFDEIKSLLLFTDEELQSILIEKEAIKEQ